MKRLNSIVAIFMAALLSVAFASPTAASTRNTEMVPSARMVAPQDTIIINLPNEAKMTLVIKDTDQLGTLREYNLDSLMIMLEKYAKQVEEAAKASDAKQITLDFYPNQDTTQKNAPEKVSITLSTTRTGGDERQSQNQNLEILIAKALKIDVDYNDETSKTTVRVNRQSDTTQVEGEEHREEKKKSCSTKLGLDVDLGLNTLVNSEPYVNPTGESANYDLRPLGSRYVSINTHLEPRIGGPSSPLHLRTGLEFAFNNYMFDKNVVLRDEGDQAVFFLDPEQTYMKTKLATSSVNLPLMITLKFKNSRGKNAFSIGAGGFVGHRLGAHTKVKYAENGRNNKDKERGNFNLTDVQYGTNFLLSFGSLQLFAKYNMNPLFRANRGPEVNTVSFGLTLLD